MANTFSNYFKVITPIQSTATVQDNQHIDGTSCTVNNYSWYQRLLVGSATRLHRYTEYDVMDNDIDISRALDTIAEEMANSNTTTDINIELDIITEDEEQMDHNTVLTLKTALKFWIKIHQLDTKLFKICRNTIKMGDCFFKRVGKNKTWEWITPANVIAAAVDEHDVTKIVGFQIKTDNKNVTGMMPTTSTSTSSSRSTNGYANMYSTTEFISIDDVVRFTLNDDMSETAPFGESILKTVYKTFKQKELLEDAAIIYRIQRAPTRRVFKIDVGKMANNRIKGYIEQIKNEMRQKHIPSYNGQNGMSMDSVYNPTSMLEDIFLAQREGGKGSSVDLLQGDANNAPVEDLTFFMRKLFRGLRVPVSWMSLDDSNSVFNDGKIGSSHMEEQQFSKYVKRLQSNISFTLDAEFKRYLFDNGIHVDNTLFKIRLPDPSNFETYRQAEMDSVLLSMFSNADSVSYLSKQFILERYLQLTDEEIIKNEQLLKREKGIKEDVPVSDIAHIIYGDAVAGGDVSMGGGFASSGFGGTEPGGFGGSEPGGETVGTEPGIEPGGELPQPTEPTI